MSYQAIRGSDRFGEGGEHVAQLVPDQLREVARVKLPDLNADDLAAAERIVAGTARSMGIGVRG